LTAIESGKDSWIAQITKPAANRSSGAGSGNARGDIKQLEARLDQLRKNKGPAQQIERMEKRLADAEKAAGPAPGGPEAGKLAIDEPTLVRQAYLRTLSRLPTPDEIDRCSQYLAQSESPVAGAKGLLWTLINTKEFIVNH
jgi:hypothetical protein